jgi:hypothetical protein
VGEQGHHQHKPDLGMVQIETALEMFKKSGGGHLVLISSVLGNTGVPGGKPPIARARRA